MRALAIAGLLLVAACGSGDDEDTAEPTASTAATTSAAVTTSPPTTSPATDSVPTSARATAPGSTVPTTVAPVTDPATTTATTDAPNASPTDAPPPIGSPIQVAWIGGSEVVLWDVSLPAIANGLGLAHDGRPLEFRAVTGLAPSPTATRDMVTTALAEGVEALIVTFNPQWLYGRVCEGVEPPHARYACLLEDGEIVGGAAIDELVATIAAAGVPALAVLTPTSVDALEDPQLDDLIVLANDRLQERIAAAPSIVVLDESLTAGRPEFREGVGFYDMVHATPDGAPLLAELVTSQLLPLLP